MSEHSPVFISQAEYDARIARNCVACGSAKEQSMLVCWDCFKRGPNPLKWFDGTFEQWMKKQGARI